jgi:hypothetical protein
VKRKVHAQDLLLQERLPHERLLHLLGKPTAEQYREARLEEKRRLIAEEQRRVQESIRQRKLMESEVGEGMSSETVWIVGRFAGRCAEGVAWDFQGVFDTEAQAQAACRDSWYFIAPAEVNRSLPDATEIWPRARYPLEDSE